MKKLTITLLSELKLHSSTNVFLKARFDFKPYVQVEDLEKLIPSLSELAKGESEIESGESDYFNRVVEDATTAVGKLKAEGFDGFVIDTDADFSRLF